MSDPAISPHTGNEELLVRTAAQLILTWHLFADDKGLWPRPPVPTDPQFWPSIELDLSGATLVEFTLQGRVSLANFTNTRFIGGANFAHAAFDDHVYFRGARFEDGSAHFYGTLFGLRAVFIDANFGETEANFDGATFCGMAIFTHAQFGGGVTMTAARALSNFNTSWGTHRAWPKGWTERALTVGEQSPRPRWGRWAMTTEHFRVTIGDFG